MIRASALCLTTWGLYFVVLWPRMLFERSDGLYAGWRTVWADWVAHFAYANVFAYRAPGEWFARNPLFATQDFDYPFLVDAISGVLMRVGWDRIAAFLVPSLLASLLLVWLLAVFYALQLRSWRGALLASSLFFANGGMGFVLFAEQLLREPSLELLRLPPHEYTYLPEQQVEWINIVSSEILPQRALLLGMPIALAVLISLWRSSRSGFRDAPPARLCGLGLLASLLVVIHPHSFLALTLLCAVFFAFHLRHVRHWLLFAASAAAPSLILLGAFHGDIGPRNFLAWTPGWLTHGVRSGDIPLWLFLWLNWGAFLPLAAFSVLRFRAYRDPLVLGGILLFVLSFLIRFQPNEWDNTKILTWAHLLLCLPVARYLLHLWAKRRLIPRALAVMLFAFVTVSGFLEVWRVTRTEQLAVRMWTNQEIALAEAFRQLSTPEALVLCSDDHHHWVPALSGRTVLLGYRGWLASYGVDFAAVERDVRIMLAGESEAEPLLARYGVDFVVVGPSERRWFGARGDYFLRRHQLVLESADTQVFRLVDPWEGDGS